MKRAKITRELMDNIYRKRRQGMSMSDLAREYGVNLSTVSRCLLRNARNRELDAYKLPDGMSLLELADSARVYPKVIWRIYLVLSGQKPDSWDSYSSY